MAMVAGTVTVDDAGVETKTAGSLAETIYDTFVAAYAVDTGETIPVGADGAPIKEGYAALARNLAGALVPWLAANADVRITTSDGALQRDDATSNDTLAPSADRVLSGALE